MIMGLNMIQGFFLIMAERLRIGDPYSLTPSRLQLPKTIQRSLKTQTQLSAL